MQTKYWEGTFAVCTLLVKELKESCYNPKKKIIYR